MAWRFGLAAIACAAMCLFRGDTLRFPLKVHLELIALGLLMFCVSYICVYEAETYVVSGLVAVGYSASPLLNMLVSRVILKTPITIRVLVGGLLGLIGVLLVYGHEFRHLQADRAIALGAAFTAAAVVISSIANAFATRASQLGLNIWQKMSWGMAYGAFGCTLWAVFQGHPLAVHWTLPYISSLVYLAFVGSVLTFAAYFAFMSREGAARAGYIGVMTPIVALVLSAIFEAYQFTAFAILGIVLAVVGNVVILREG